MAEGQPPYIPQTDFAAIVENAEAELNAPARRAAGQLVAVLSPFYTQPEKRMEMLGIFVDATRDYVEIARHPSPDKEIYLLDADDVIFRLEPIEGIDYVLGGKYIEANVTKMQKPDVFEEEFTLSLLGLSQVDIFLLEDMLPLVREAVRDDKGNMGDKGE